MTTSRRVLCCLLLNLCCWKNAAVAVEVVDYKQRRVHLAHAARRIVALAPHIVENLFAAGAGGQIVGVVDYCDYPAAALDIPRVGSLSGYSLEAIARAKPDLIVLWDSGHSAHMLTQLEKLGVAVYVSDPRHLQDVPRSIRDYGVLSGHEEHAELAAAAFETRRATLQARYSHKPPVRTLYQVWNDPIQTINDKHIISDVMRLCGGENAFGDALALAPKISVESVIARNPDAIIASGMAEQRPDWLDDWKAWPLLKAVTHNHLYFIPPDIIQRHTPRILDGAAMLCEQLDRSRAPPR